MEIAECLCLHHVFHLSICSSHSLLPDLTLLLLLTTRPSWLQEYHPERTPWTRNLRGNPQRRQREDHHRSRSRQQPKHVQSKKSMRNHVPRDPRTPNQVPRRISKLRHQQKSPRTSERNRAKSRRRPNPLMTRLSMMGPVVPKRVKKAQPPLRRRAKR